MSVLRRRSRSDAKQRAERAMSTLGAMVLEDGETTWGSVAQPWQFGCAKAVLLGDPPNRWEGRPRGASKTTDASGIACAALLDVFEPGAEAYVVASDKDQARLTVNALRGIVMRTEALRSSVSVEANRAIFRNGSFLEVLAADGPSTWGLKPDLVIVDELSAWKSTDNAREVWEAITTAMGKKPDARLVVLSMAGSPGHWSFEVRQHAKRSKQWSVGDIPGPLPWTDPAFLEEQRALHPESTYRRLFLNEWVSGEDSLASRGDVEACITLSGPQMYDPRHTYLLTIDVGLKHDRSVVAVTHAEDEWATDGTLINRRLILDELEVRQGTPDNPVNVDSLEAYIWQTAERYGHAKAVFDESRAEQAIQRLSSRGLRAEVFKFTTASVGRLGVALHQAIRTHRLSIWRHPMLIDEMLTVKLVEKGPGSYRLDHASGKHDDMCVCLAMACIELLEQPLVGPVEQFFNQFHALRESENTDPFDNVGEDDESLVPRYFESPAQIAMRQAAALTCAFGCGNPVPEAGMFCTTCDPDQARERVAK